MSKTIDNEYIITSDDMLLMNILNKIEEDDDEESFYILKQVVSKKNGILYYSAKSTEGLGFDSMFLDAKKGSEENLSVSDLIAYALAHEDKIIGYTTLKKKNFKGVISKIGIISGYDIAGKVIKDIPIYNKVPTNVIGILPVERVDENSGESVIKYIFVCSTNTIMDFIYKAITIGTFAGIILYKLITFVINSIEMAKM